MTLPRSAPALLGKVSRWRRGARRRPESPVRTVVDLEARHLGLRPVYVFIKSHFL